MSWRKRNKAASWKASSLILILCPNTMGAGCFFGGEHIPRPSERENDGVIGVSITFYLSWVTFSEGENNWTMTVWPYALWKSMCKCCGLLFLAGKVKHCKVTEQGDSKEVNQLWKQCSCTLSASICGVNAACQLFVFGNLEKIYLVFTGEPERWTDNFHSFRLGTHLTFLSGCVASTSVRLLQVSHTQLKHTENWEDNKCLPM